MANAKMILDVVVASNVLINITLTQKETGEADISSPTIPYDELLYGFIGLNAKVVSILREEGIEEFQIRKEIRGYADEVEDLDALFFMRDRDGNFDPRTKELLENTPPEKAVAEIIAVIFGIFIQDKDDATQRFIHLQTALLEDLAENAD